MQIKMIIMSKNKGIINTPQYKAFHTICASNVQTVQCAILARIFKPSTSRLKIA